MAFHYCPIFLLGLLFLNPPHRLFITFTRISLVLTESNSSWEVRPLTVELSAPFGPWFSPICLSLRLLTDWESLIFSIYGFRQNSHIKGFASQIKRFGVFMFSVSGSTTSRPRHHPHYLDMTFFRRTVEFHGFFSVTSDHDSLFLSYPVRVSEWIQTL